MMQGSIGGVNIIQHYPILFTNDPSIKVASCIITNYADDKILNAAVGWMFRYVVKEDSDIVNKWFADNLMLANAQI